MRVKRAGFQLSFFEKRCLAERLADQEHLEPLVHGSVAARDVCTTAVASGTVGDGVAEPTRKGRAGVVLECDREVLALDGFALDTELVVKGADDTIPTRALRSVERQALAGSPVPAVSQTWRTGQRCRPWSMPLTVRAGPVPHGRPLAALWA
jgi:hypothetical protein